jgi:hypothetical protein
MSEDRPQPQTDQRTGEVCDSLNGREEMWIAEQFGKSIGELTGNYLERNDYGPFYRALIFVLKRRDGLNEDDARNQVMDMRLSDVVAYFPRAEDGDEAGEPGKGEPVSEKPAEQPETAESPLRVISPASAS